MEKSEFIELVENAKPHINGSGRKIAEKSGISYDQYHNYIKGIAPDETLRKLIANAILDHLRSINKNISQILAAG